MEGKESPVDLALHVGEVRGRQAALEEKQREQEAWRTSADQRLNAQDERLKNLPAEVVAALEDVPPDPPAPPQPTSAGSPINSSTAKGGSIADPTAPPNSDAKDAGRVAPPPAVPNPNDRPPVQPTPNDLQQQIDNPPPPPPKRGILNRFR